MFSLRQIRDMYSQRKILDKIRAYGKIPPEDCYVYIAQQGPFIVYVGKGTDWRFLHPNTGQSSCKDLNKGHFDGVVYDVYLLKMSLTKEAALELEHLCIEEFAPRYNVRW